MTSLTKGFSVIDKFGLAEYVLRLANQEGKSSREIAELLCQHEKLVEEGVTISHVAVSGWLKREREAVQEVTNVIVAEEARKSIRSNIEMANEVKNRLMSEFRVEKIKVVVDGGLFGSKVEEVPVDDKRLTNLSNALEKYFKLTSDSGGLGPSGTLDVPTLADLMHRVPDCVDDEPETGGDSDD